MVFTGMQSAEKNNCFKFNLYMFLSGESYET